MVDRVLWQGKDGKIVDMQKLPERSRERANWLRWGMLGGLAAIALLVGYGVWRFPTTLESASGYRGVAGVAIILVLYGLTAWFGPALTEDRDAYVLGAGIAAGLIVGAIFIVEILAEYVFLPQDNTPFGLLEYGAVLVVFGLVSGWTAWQRNSFKKGVATAVWSAMIGGVIWYTAVLLVFYLFLGSPQQTQVLRAEGDYDDILRSGMTDFGAFMVQDFMGAGFFHSLLLPTFAAIAGSLGAVAGKVAARIKR